MTVPTTQNPSDPAYKKAKRQYLKTTHNRLEQLEAEWTPFRAAEKKYKAKFPPPDLTNVLDVALLDESRVEETKRGSWRGGANAVECHSVDLLGQESRGRKAYVFPSIPGLVLLPSFVSPDDQRRLVRWSLRDHARHPNETNLDTHYILPEEGLWKSYISSGETGHHEEDIQPRASTSSSPIAHINIPPGPRQLISNEPASTQNFAKIVTAPTLPAAPSLNAKVTSAASLIPKLRWANIGWYYHWGNKQYDFARGKINVSSVYSEVCKSAVKTIPWEEVFSEEKNSSVEWGDEPDWKDWQDSYEPDAGIVNFYQTRDTLMAHVDRSEVCATSPLVSISLGCAAVFLIGGSTRDTEPMPILLRSGDVVVMSGPRCRRAYHGVPRILENTLPPHFIHGVQDKEWEPYEEYLQTSRININVRQVFPKGFNPGL
ncbi:hypothetical protein PHLCEN_2v2050 [Hermanssonia centrifuga]|uniref:Fe2OG dioxygenase domain-containing protein n=1 Tax=Hermanssonia centrifuga TaxID=98765 RepID=A0A2R6RQ99_9APHY|nr:hypothetical protein PHLCEN_2v2050 [Hermanssonia centrifuga]